MGNKKLSVEDLYSFQDVRNILEKNTSYYEFMATRLPASTITMSKICRVLPYTIKTASGQQLRPVIVPVKEGCSFLPRQASPTGFVLLPQDYVLCDKTRLQQIIEFHNRKSQEITKLLTVCYTMGSGDDNPTPLLCTKGLRIEVIKADRPNGSNEPGYILCSVDEKGNKCCRVSAGIWATEESARAALNTRCFPPLEAGVGASCHGETTCFGTNMISPSLPGNNTILPREYFE